MSNKKDLSNSGFATRAIRTQADRSQNREHSSPVYMTSSFVFDNAEHARSLFSGEIDGAIYSRYANPSVDEFIEKMCLLEGTEDGIATASGMSAMFTSIAALLSNGDHIVASRSIFGSTHQIISQILPRWGISYTYVDCTDNNQWQEAINENTRMLFAETPTNPGLDIIDLEFLGTLARKKDLILNIDNCFATPFLQNPAQWGAHLVTHSATKYIDGQGRALGGIILGNKNLIEKIRFFSRHTGPALSPFNSWLFAKSLETLEVRMQKHCSNAMSLARNLKHHSVIKSVKYPYLSDHPGYDIAKKQMRFGGGIVTFELSQGYEQARRFLDNLTLISLSANLGDTRTIATHPASTTHSKLTEEERKNAGISPGLIRISVGLEDFEDIMKDITQALEKSLE